MELLRVIQERSFERVGSNKSIKSDVRIVAATHRNLEVLIEEGRFREDLYYRLNVLPISTPPLRERSVDVPLLLDFFAKKFTLEGDKEVSFAPDFAQALRAYQWPGNVRELSNLVDRFSTLFAGQRLSLRSLPAALLPKGLVSAQAELQAKAPLLAKMEMTPPPEVLKN